MSKKTTKQPAASETAPTEAQAHDEVATSVAEEGPPSGTPETEEDVDQVAALREKIAELKAEIVAAADEANERATQIFALQEAAARAEAEYAATLAQIAEVYGAERDSLKESVAAAEAATAAMQARAETAEGNMVAAQANFDEALSAASQATNHARDERDQCIGQVATLTARAEDAVSERVRLEAQLTQAQAKLAAFEALNEGHLYVVRLLDRKLAPIYVVATSAAHALEVAERRGYAKETVRSTTHFADKVAL